MNVFFGTHLKPISLEVIKESIHEMSSNNTLLKQRPPHLSAANELTLKWLGHFFQNVILFSNVVQHQCNIFYMNLVQCNGCLASIVYTDGLVL